MGWADGIGFISCRSWRISGSHFPAAFRVQNTVCGVTVPLTWTSILSSISELVAEVVAMRSAFSSFGVLSVWRGFTGLLRFVMFLADEVLLLGEAFIVKSFLRCESIMSDFQLIENHYFLLLPLFIFRCISTSRTSSRRKLLPQ